jgi:hypothetical protein
MFLCFAFLQILSRIPPVFRDPQGCPRHLFRTTIMFMIIFICMLLTVKIRQPSHEFTFGVAMSFIPYPLVLTPVV